MIQAGGIFMASKVKKKQNLQGLTEQQKHIIKLRNELNKPDSHQVKAFTLYKIITYVFNVLFPPYALYRIWCKKSEIHKNRTLCPISCCSDNFMYVCFIAVRKI